MTLQQRYLIQTLYQQHKTQQDIAKQIGVSPSTVSRELAKHNQDHPQQVYDAQRALQRAEKPKKRTPYKLKSPLLATVIDQLRDRLSSEQISGKLQLKASRRVLHHETGYRYIYRH
jgi:IS30 family transposase